MFNYLKFPVLTLSATIALTVSILSESTAEARHKHAAAAAPARHSSASSKHHSSHSSRSGHTAAASTGHSRHGHEVAHHGRHHVVAHAAPKTRYAYPLGLFMRSAPPFDSSPLSSENAAAIARAFERGTADGYPARTLVRAGIVHHYPLHGGIFWRREPIKYIVMHSTETGVPTSAVNVINGWTSMGMRHPGAQYVVERDGTIYQAVDPDLATVHVNIFKTLPGINNDNSIGIEMNHTGSQEYPAAQRDAVIKLVGYLKHRYAIEEGNIITHRYAQQGDHTDPVHFDWDGFLAQVNNFHNQAIAYRNTRINADAKLWQREPEPKANTYLKPHKELGKNSRPEVVPAVVPVVETGATTDAPVETREGEHVMDRKIAPSSVPLPGRPATSPVYESPVPEASEADRGAPVQAPTPGAKPRVIDGTPVKPVAPQAPIFPTEKSPETEVETRPNPNQANQAKEAPHVDPNFESAVDPNFDPSVDSK